jgi:putative transposase
MHCPYCTCPTTKEHNKKTSLGYRTFRCLGCRRTFNERTATPFKYLEYPTDIVLLVVVYRLRYKLSWRDIAEMFLERGFEFTHEAVRDWEARFASLMADQLLVKRRGQVGVCWHVDETSVKVQGTWCYLYRAIDRDGNLVDSMLSEKRDMDAAKRFFQQALQTVVTLPSESRPMGMTPIPVRSARRLAVMSCTGPTRISIIGWSKIIVASSSATTRCVVLEASPPPLAFVGRSIKCASSFASVPP